MPYNRDLAVDYAKKWALGRNPAFYDFEKIGGDCTNFVSQCIYAGKNEMNYQKDTGWYYISVNDRSGAWTSVEYLYAFLTNNKDTGPKGKEISLHDARKADIIQFSYNGSEFSHSLFITQTQPEILVCAHTFDVLDKPLRLYNYSRFRCIQIY